MIPAHRILQRVRPELFKVELTSPCTRRSPGYPNKTKGAISPTMRAAVLERDDHQCCQCGAGENLTLHHIKLRKDGGKNVADNLITLCRTCHEAEHCNMKAGQPTPRRRT